MKQACLVPYECINECTVVLCPLTALEDEPDIDSLQSYVSRVRLKTTLSYTAQLLHKNIRIFDINH